MKEPKPTGRGVLLVAGPMIVFYTLRHSAGLAYEWGIAFFAAACAGCLIEYRIQRRKPPDSSPEDLL